MNRINSVKLFLIWGGFLLCLSSFPFSTSEAVNDHIEHHHFRRHKRQKIPILRNDNLEAMEVLHRGLQFLDKVQNPENCTGHPYMIRTIGFDSGFAAQFQWAASVWMRTLAETDFAMPIILQGRWVGYSEGKECESYGYSWNCYFLPVSRCEQELLKTGKLVAKTSKTVTNEESIPPAFQSSGFFVWWGIIQAYLFRFQPYVEHYILSATHHMSNGRAFPFGLPMIGVHVRHGDKHTDQWKEYSLQEELQGITGSPDCHVKSSYSTNSTLQGSASKSIPICFTKINIVSDRLLLWQIFRNELIALHKSDISKYDSVRTSAATSRSIHEILKSQSHHPSPNMNESTLFNFYREYHLDPFAYYHIHEFNLTKLIQKYRSLDQPLPTVSSSSSAPNDVDSVNFRSDQYVSPLDIYIASDDANVIAAARNLSFFVNKEGVSQQTQGKAMIDIVMKESSTAFEAALQIISDIFLLSQCSTLIGTAGSQVFRMAVGLAKAKGFLHHVKALDYNQMNKLRKMSRRYALPCPEDFSP